MIINQLSVFLENRAGQLSEFVNILAENNIDLQALSISETQDYGLLRIIVDDPKAVEAVAKEKGWLCTVTPVLAVLVPDEPGSLVSILDTLSKSNISIAYSYASLTDREGHACIILRVDDNEVTEKILKDAGIICE
ncbi:MAG: ACT domain-containing protein [Clostridia bacterium]|nr:ACT domain-containing protein [Clostridia bacterium]